MDQETTFEFINSQTANIIGYLSLPASLAKEEQIKKLDAEKDTLATAHKLEASLIYWQDQKSSI